MYSACVQLLALKYITRSLNYFLTKQEGASKEDIKLLPKFTFRREGGVGKTNDEIQGFRGGVMTEYGTETPIEHILSYEEAVRYLSFCSVLFYPVQYALQTLLKMIYDLNY